MDENQKPEALADKVVSDINRDFSVVGKTRIHSWYAWAMVGVCVGMFSGILYVANRSIRFDQGMAAFESEQKLPASEPLPPLDLPTRVISIIEGFQQEYGQIARVTLEEARVGVNEDGEKIIKTSGARDFVITTPSDWSAFTQPFNTLLNGPVPTEITLSTSIMRGAGITRPYLLLGPGAFQNYAAIVDEVSDGATTDGAGKICTCNIEKTATLQTSDGSVVVSIADEDPPILLGDSNADPMVLRKKVDEEKDACTDDASCKTLCNAKATITLEDIKKKIDRVVQTATNNKKAKAVVLTIVEGNTTEGDKNGICKDSTPVSG